jgi:fatty acid desaturase
MTVYRPADEIAADRLPPRGLPAGQGRYYRRLNMAIFAAHAGATLFLCFGLPLLLLPMNPTWAWLLVPVALAGNGYWALLHEAIHGQLHPDQTVNRRLGRTLACLFGSSFRLLRFGHLMHHRFNRHRLDRLDVYDAARTRPWLARLRFFAEAFGGLYVIEVLVPLLYWLPPSVVQRLLHWTYAGNDEPIPELRRLALQALGAPRSIQEMRMDAAAVLGITAFAFWCWGSQWPLILAFAAGRGALVSLLDNVYHFRTPIDRPDFAYNLSLPRPLQRLFLNMNLHRVHHHNMQLPWWRLPQQFVDAGESYDGKLVSGALAQLKGPAPVWRRSDAARQASHPLA